MNKFVKRISLEYFSNVPLIISVIYVCINHHNYGLKLYSLLQSWHKRCFTCAACSRHLDSVTVNDAPDGEIYCKACYGQKFGVRGVGFGLGAGALNMVRGTRFPDVPPFSFLKQRNIRKVYSHNPILL